MKDSEFLELLNLYVDQEITPEAAARLEAEVISSPGRRKLYRQYCLIHKGCSLLTGAVAGQAPAPVRGRAIDREARSFWGWSGVFAAGGLAAAACIAAVVTVRNHGTPSRAASPAVAAASVRPTAAAELADRGDLNVAMVAPAPSSFPSPFGGGPLQTAFNTRAWANPGSAVSGPGVNDSLAWIDQVKLTPLSHPGLLIPIEIRDSAILLPLDTKASPLNLGPSEPTEVTAFEFQRK